ncbi:hypothetical protein JW877_03225 [bacterium]|nr:hypothetical protein [bacterium]
MEYRKINYLKALVGYLGLLQVAHFFVLIRAGIMLFRRGIWGFPASPPPDGWSSQAVFFLIALGIIDGLNAIVSLVFVYLFFKGNTCRLWLGTLTLTAIMITGFTYSLVIIGTGALECYPGQYLGIGLAFLPILILTIIFIGRAGKTDPGQRTIP